MAINYKKELEGASRSMILIHDPDLLIKMIVRMIVQKVKVVHAGILLYKPERNAYILTVSRGPQGLKIPAGFARMDKDNALIRLLTEYKNMDIFPEGAFVLKTAKKALRKKISPDLKQTIKGALYQMEIFDAVTCIPSYYRNELLGTLLLGKKNNGREFSQEELDFFVALASDVAMAIRNAQLFKELESELDKKRRLFIHTTIALAAAIDAKDHYTHGHTARVTSLSLDIARKLSQMNESSLDAQFLEHLNIAGLLHDIGKIGIPESILNKSDLLDEEERKKMEEHPLIGVAILEPIKELENAILGVKYHHEKYDGSGYPEKLKGDQIPLVAAIIAVADTFDAMTTDRPYRKGLSQEEAIAEITRMSNKQFHPQIVSAFTQICLQKKT